MAQEITLPVKLQLENLQAITKEMRTQLSTLKVDSSGYKKLEGVIADIEKRIQALQVASARPLVDKKQFTDVEKEVLHISDDLTKIRIEAGKVKFSDIKLDASQQQKLQEFDNQIKAINESLKQTQARAKEAFLKSDLGQQWSEKHDDAPAQSFQKLTQEIEKEVRTQQKLLKEAEQAQDSYKEKIAAHDRLKAFIKNGGDLKEAKNMLPEVYNSIFRSDGKAFKAGGKNILKQWLTEQFQLDPAFIENLVSQSGEKVQQALSDSSSEIFKKLKQESNRLGAEVGTRKEQATRKQNLASDVTQKANDLQTAKAVQGQLNEEELKEQGIQEGLRQQLQQTQAARQNYCSGITEQTRSTLQMGQASEKAQTQLDNLNKTVATGKAKLESIDKATSKLQGISNFVNRYIGAYAIIRRVTQAIRNAFNNIKELDKTITNIAVVTNMSQEQLWSKVGQYTQIAQQYGVMTKDVYTVSQLFYQQGLQTSQVMELTTETLKMAKIAGMDYTAATNAMTVAVRAFNIEMSEAQQVTDTYSALAAKFAVSSAEIANAMEKTASSAANVGMSLQSTSAFMSVMIQTTRESAQNIGSALKSIISRYGEMKASPSSLVNVDGEEVAFNKVDTALKSVGISIKDASGQFRDFDDVIMELAAKWNTLDNNTQRYIATVMAGNRQQSRFIALVSNYDELSRAMQVASDSENASIVQVAKTMDSLESKANQLKNAFSQLYLDLHIESGLKGIYDWLTRILQTVGKLGILKGALPTLLNIVGLGTGTKSLINTISQSIQAKKLKIQADVSEAESEIERVKDTVKEPVIMNVKANVDASEIDAAKADLFFMNNPTLHGAATTLTGQITEAGSSKSQGEILQALALAKKEGRLATKEGRAEFMGEMEINSDSQAHIDNLLIAFDKLAVSAENASASVDKNTTAIDTNTTAEGNNTTEKETDTTVTEENIATQQNANTSTQQVTQAQIDLARSTGTSAKEIERLEDKMLSQQAAIENETNSEEINAEANQEDAQTERENARANRENTDSKKSTSGTLVKTIGALSAVSRLLGTAITATGASIQDKSTDDLERSKLYTGIGNGLSMAGTFGSIGLSIGGPLGAAIGGVIGLVTGGLGAILDAVDHTLSEKIELAKKEAKEAGDISLKAQAKVIDFKSSLENIKTLQKAMYNSTDDMQAYKDAMNTLAEEYPDLISSYDAAGNAIIDLSNAESELAELRKESADAARDAAVAEMNQYELELAGYKSIEDLIMSQMQVNTSVESAGLGGWLNILPLPIKTKIEATKRHGFSVTEEYSASKATEENTIGYVSDKNGNLFPVLKSSNFKISNEMVDLATGSIDYMGAITEALESEGLDVTQENVKAKATEFANGTAVAPTGYKTLQGNANAAYTQEEWQYFLDMTSDDNGYLWDVAEVNKELQKYTSLFGKEVTVESLLGGNVGSQLNINQMSKLGQIVENKRAQQERKTESSRKIASKGTAESSLYYYADQKLVGEDLNNFENNGLYSQLLYNLLEQQRDTTKYTDIYSWYANDFKNYDEIAKEQSNLLLDWYAGLSSSQQKALETIDLTAYTSTDDLISQLKLTNVDDAIYQALTDQFIETNKTNRERILNIIYGENNTLNIDALGNIIESGQDNSDALVQIASLFEADKNGASKVISKYANYFATQLLEIDELMEDGYTQLASTRFSILNSLLKQIGSLGQSEQDALFGIITSIDFTDYDSIIDAYAQIEEYQKNNDLSASATEAVEETLDLLDKAKNSLVFNLNTLVNTIADKVLTASKNVDTILSTNKSGLSLDSALEKLNDLQVKDSTISFDEMFQYDATLGKYVYTKDGLLTALAAEEENLNDNVKKATQVVGYYQDILETEDLTFIEGEDGKADYDQMMANAKDIFGEDSSILPYYGQLVQNYDKTKGDWDTYLKNELTNAIDDEAKVEQILQQYYANKKNTLYAQIDWGKLALGTDYFGTNKTLVEQLASEVLDAGTYTWEEVLDAYLDSVYGEGESAAKSAAKAAAMQTIDQEKASNLTTAISEVLNGTVNKYYSDATKTLLTQAGYETSQLENNLTASITAAVGFLRGMREMIGTSQVTLEQYNEQAKTILDKTLGIYSRDKSGLDFATGTIDSSALQNLANTLGLELTDIVDVATGYIRGEIGKVLSYNSLTNSYEIIADTFEDFIAALEEQFGITIERTSKEYMAALKTYNDNKLKKNTEINDNITEELEKVMSGKAGDQLNIAYIFSSLSATALHELAHYGLQLQDGILTIGATADIPGAIDYITKQLQEAGALLPEEIAKLNDTLLNYFQNITNLIKNGIGGSLSYENKDELQKWFSSRPGREGQVLDFTRTANGFKLTQKSAEALYDELVQVDSISAGIVLDELNKSIDESITGTKNLRHEIEELRATTESEDFKFMNKSIPSGQNNPLNYLGDSGWSKAFETISEAGANKGLMEYEDFYNIMTEIGNLAELSSDEIQLGAGYFIDSAAKAAELIEQGAQYLTIAADGSVKVDLSKFGSNFLVGSQEMRDSVGEGIQDVAKAQVDILDTMIRFLEPLAAMEDLKDLAGEDGIFDLNEIFNKGIVTEGFTKDFITKKQQILNAAQENEDLLYGLQHTIIGERNLYQILESDGKALSDAEAKALQAYLNASQSADFDASNPNSWQQVLASFGFEGEFEREDKSKIVIKNGTVLEMTSENKYLYNGKEFESIEAVDQAKTLDNAQILALEGKNKTYDQDTGAISYEITEDLTATVSYNINDDGKYHAKFADGEEVIANSPEALSTGIRHYMLMSDTDLKAIDTESDIQQYTIMHAGVTVDVEYDVSTGETSYDFDTPNSMVAAGRITEIQLAGDKLKETVEYAEDNPIDITVTNENALSKIDEVKKSLKDLAKYTAINIVPDGLEKEKTIVQEAGKTIINTLIKPLKEQIAQEKWAIEAQKNADYIQMIEDTNASVGTHLENYIIPERSNDFTTVYTNAGRDEAEKQMFNSALSEVSMLIHEGNKEWSIKYLDGGIVEITHSVDLMAIAAQDLTNNIPKLVQTTSVPEPKKGPIPQADVENTEEEITNAAQTIGTASIDIPEWTPDFTPITPEPPEVETLNPAKAALEKTLDIGMTAAKEVNTSDAIDLAVNKMVDSFAEKIEEPAKKEMELQLSDKSDEKLKTLLSTDNTVELDADDSQATEAIEHVNHVLNQLAGKSVQAMVNIKMNTDYSDLPAIAKSQMLVNTNGSGRSTRQNMVQAKGNLALAQGTLMGELGPELVVSNGRYFVAGQNGAEFINLDPDAIVFNHLQTQSLLSRGMSNGRGKALTSEKRSVAYATGNVNGGPAMASAKQALAALKQLRAQWQAIAGMDAKSLANLGGSGGSGGGGSDASDPKAFTKELEKWYNWLQRIAVLEQKITYEEQKRSKIQSDMYAHGQDYAKSHMETLDYLRESAVVSKSLYDSQQEYFEQRRAEMNSANNPFSALYTFDEYGQLKYQNGAFAQLAGLSGRNALTGEGNYTAADQYAKLVAMGFEKYMQYDSSGNKIDTSSEDWEVTAVQAFWDKMDADKEEMQSLHDSIEEHKKAVLEKQQQANEIMKEIEDNQISVEDKVLKAIIDTREREIDELQKQRDAIEEASNNLINGLSEQLNKEKEMYSSQQNQDELSKLQRQLGILQRSGGSASQIANLQKEISQKQQDAYFDAQQKQIDALQEASDNELERLDNQIELMKETLEYEKENGLLWNQVYEVMAGTPEQITEFIMTHDSEFWGQSPTKDTQTYRETLFEAQQFKAYEGYMKDGFDALVKSFDDFAIAEAARDEEANANATTSSEVDTGAASSTPTTSSDSGGSSNPTNDSSTSTKSTVTDLTGAILAGLTSGAENVTKASQQIQLKKTLVSGKGILRTYDSGGIIDQDQIALVHAKESVLTPEQTSILRNEILSNKPTSLLSLLTDFRDAYNSIPSASDYNTVNNNDGVTIEQAIVEMHVAKIANDYDAQRAGESALEKMVQIARKTQGQRIGR